MSCGKCEGKSGKCGRKGLCPLSFGIALGLTSAICAAIFMGYLGIYGVPPEMAHWYAGPLTWAVGIKMTLWWLLKGFLFGLVLALIYDLIVCCCRKGGGCCKSSHCKGSCCCGKESCPCKCCNGACQCKKPLVQ